MRATAPLQIRVRRGCRQTAVGKRWGVRTHSRTLRSHRPDPRSCARMPEHHPLSTRARGGPPGSARRGIRKPKPGRLAGRRRRTAVLPTMESDRTASSPFPTGSDIKIPAYIQLRPDGLADGEFLHGPAVRQCADDEEASAELVIRKGVGGYGSRSPLGSVTATRRALPVSDVSTRNRRSVERVEQGVRAQLARQQRRVTGDVGVAQSTASWATRLRARGMLPG